MKKTLLIITWTICHLALGQTNNQYTEILRKADLFRAGQIDNVSWDITVQNFKQNKLVNEIGIFVEAKTFSNDQLVLISFLSPKKFGGQQLLIRNNNMWFSKKGIDNKIPISGRQRLTGSASNADVANANYFMNYTIASVKEEVLENNDCYVFDLLAKDNYVSYYKIRYWITKKENLAIKTDYFGKSEKLIKTAHFEYENVENYKGKPTKFISKTTIKDDINQEDYTVLQSSSFKFTMLPLSKFDK